MLDWSGSLPPPTDPFDDDGSLRVDILAAAALFHAAMTHNMTS